MAKRLISAVIPTRGDVDLGPIIANLLKHEQIAEIVIERGDTVHNRYEGVRKARYPVVFTQDDDVIPDVGPILASYRPGIVVNAMTAKGGRNYSGAETLVGYGAVFDKRLVEVLNGWERDELFLRECDRVFTSLNKHHTIYPGLSISPCARGPNRLYKQSGHSDSVKRMRERISEWISKNKH